MTAEKHSRESRSQEDDEARAWEEFYGDDRRDDCYYIDDEPSPYDLTINDALPVVPSNDDAPHFAGEGLSVPYFEIKLEILRKMSELSGLEGFERSDSKLEVIQNRQKRYGAQYGAVRSNAIAKKERLPREIMAATTRIVGAKALAQVGYSNAEINELRLGAYNDFTNRFAGSNNATKRAEQIEVLEGTLGMHKVKSKKKKTSIT